jgi:hypothetical protein
MAAYARDDTHLLIKTWLKMKYHHMKPEYEVDWKEIVDKCNKRTQLTPKIKPYPTMHQAFLSAELQMDKQDLFQELYFWRKRRKAKYEDEKPQSIMSDEDLRNCCLLIPTTLTSVEDEGKQEIGLNTAVKMNKFLFRYAGELISIIENYLLQKDKEEWESDEVTHKVMKSVVVKVPNMSKSESDFQILEHLSVHDKNSPGTGCEIQHFGIPTVQREKIPEKQQESESDSERDEIREMLEDLSSIYDTVPVEDILEDRNGIKTVEVQNLTITRRWSEEMEEVSDAEVETLDGKAKGVMCCTCFIPGHPTNECKYKDLKLRNEPKARAMINTNKKEFYNKRPEIKTNRNGKMKKNYQMNKAYKKACPQEVPGENPK